MFRNYREYILRELRLDAISGFFAIAPFVLIAFLTGVVFRVSYAWVGALADGLLDLVLPESWQVGPFAQGNTQWLSVILLFALLVTLGMFVRRAIGKISLHLVEQLLLKTPLIGPIYAFSRKLTDAFSNAPGRFQRVVSVPAEGGKRELAFVTGSIVDEATGATWLSIFIPMGVTGTGKQYIIPADGDVVETDAQPEEVLQWYGTFGVVGISKIRLSTNS